MCLVQKSRDLTHDIDTYCEQRELLHKYAVLVSKTMHLNECWLNAGGDLYVTRPILADARVYLKYTNLVVYTPTDEAMLAMKVASARDADKSHDLNDAAYLNSLRF